MTFAYHAQLATWRARVGPSEYLALALFGVGRETLQRIESGEVEPEAEIAERIELELRLSGDIGTTGGAGLSPRSALPGRSPAHGGDPLSGGAATSPTLAPPLFSAGRGR